MMQEAGCKRREASCILLPASRSLFLAYVFLTLFCYHFDRSTNHQLTGY